MRHRDQDKTKRNRVLVLAYQFPPDTGSVQRVKKYVQYLPEFGWQPIVLTRKISEYRNMDQASLHGLPETTQIVRVGPGDWFARIRARVVGQEKSVGKDNNIEAVNVSGQGRKRLLRWLRGLYRASHAWLIWPDSAVGWLPSAFLTSLRLVITKKIRVIYTVSPPHSTHLVGVVLKWLAGVRWLADFRDPWANDPDIPMPTRFHKEVHCWAERLVLRTADEIVTTTDFHTEYMRSRLPSSDSLRVHTITNGYDPQDMANLPPYSDSGFQITYAGGFYASRSVTPFLRALAQLQAHNPGIFEQVIVRFIGSNHELMTGEIASLGIQRIVRFPGYLDHRRTIEELARSAVLLLVVHSDPLVACTSIPAKLFEYMAIGRPILAISPTGSSAELVKSSGTGVVVDPSDVEGIENTILEFFRQHTCGELDGASYSPRNLERFHRRSLTESLAALLDEIVIGKGM
ncbi:MAG: glycosyltransferase [Planctomycetota bacterium]